jgi:CHAT domain-containing protein
VAAKRVVLAEFFTTDERTLLFLVREDFTEPVVVEIPVTLRALRDFVNAHFGTGGGQDGELVQTTGQTVSALDEAAFNTFLEPFLLPLLAEAPGGGPIAAPDDVVWIVPHDVLHYLPLHAVKLCGRYLIERNPVCYSPSASVMKYCHARRKGQRSRLLVFADSRADRPLLQSRLEASALEELYHPHAEVYSGARATKSLLNRRLAEAADEIDILHLACHGTFRADQPLRSGIELAPEGGHPDSAENGWDLTAEEIFNIRLNADLVTLSACESGVNDRRPGDELIGLTRAFIYAGTPSVLVSLWSVEDISTGMLMRGFYRYLRNEVSKVESLQRAQTDMLAVRLKDVLAYCHEAETRLHGDEPSRRHLSVYIAEVQARARDWRAAAATYDRLLHETPPTDSGHEDLRGKFVRCQLAAQKQVAEGHYDRLAFCKPFYWAPFVLVGDWK